MRSKPSMLKSFFWSHSKLWIPMKTSINEFYELPIITF